MSRSISTPPTLENSSFRRSLRTKKWKEENHNESMYEDFHFDNEDYDDIDDHEQSKNKYRDRRGSRGKRTEDDKIRTRRKGNKIRKQRGTEYDRIQSNEEMEHGSRKSQFSFHPPSISGGDSAIGSIGTLGSYSEDQFWSSIPNPGAVVRVTINVNDENENETIVITLRNILAREREMRHLATEQDIGNDRWSGSLLYKKVRNAAVKQIVDKRGNYNVMISTSDHGNSNLDAVDNEAVNKSQATTENENIPDWTHLLHTVLVPFFSVGRIPVPDQATGPDVLHMLEFFALMYTPSHLDFQTFGAYIRVRLWGEYFFQRGQMYNWIADQLYSSSSLTPKKSIYLVTSPDDVADDRMQYVIKGTGKRCILFDGGLVVDNHEDDHMKQKNESSCSLVYEFFNADDSDDEMDYENSVDAQLREDFRAFIESTIQGSTVTFDMKEVELIPMLSYTRSKYRKNNHENSSSIIAERAVLHISFSKNSINSVTPEKQQSLSIEEKDTRRKSKKMSRSKNKDDCDIPMITVISSEASMSLASTLSYPHFDKQEKGTEHNEESQTNINTPAIVSPTRANNNLNRPVTQMDNASHVVMPMQATHPNSTSVNQNFVLQPGQMHAVNHIPNMHQIQPGQMHAISPTPSFQQIQPGQMHAISPTPSFQQMQNGQMQAISPTPSFQQINATMSNVSTGIPYSISPTQSMAYSTSMMSQTSNMTQKSIRDPNAAVDEANASWLWTLLTPEALMSTLCCNPVVNPNPNSTAATDSGFHDVSKLTNFNAINKNLSNMSMDNSTPSPLTKTPSSSVNQNPIASTLSTDASVKIDVASATSKVDYKTSIGLGRPPLSPAPSFRSVSTPVHGHGNASNNKTESASNEKEKSVFPWNILSFVGK